MSEIKALEFRMEAAFRASFPGDDRRIVPGEGPEKEPLLLLIGEAPGAQEAEQGRPFVGKAGRNLDEFLEVLGIERASIRISNTVKVRPSKVGPTGRLSNRPPNRQELEFFIPYLMEEIRLVQPKLLVTLGNTPLQAIAGKNTVIGSCHGTLMQIPALEMPVFPLYHPASVIYNRSLADVYRQDLLLLKETLAVR